MDAQADDLGLKDNGAYHEIAYLVAEHVSMFYPNNDDDDQEEITTVVMLGGQTHSIYEQFDSFKEKFLRATI